MDNLLFLGVPILKHIRVLLKEQFDLGLHCLSFHSHLDTLLHCKTKLFHSQNSIDKYFNCPSFYVFLVQI